MRLPVMVICTITLFASAFAQPLSEPPDEVTVVVTGHVAFEVDGRPFEQDVTATYYPEDFGADHESESLRGILEAMAGSSLHDATWMSQTYEILGMTISVSDDLLVGIQLSGSGEEEGATDWDLHLGFEVHPETLAVGIEGTSRNRIQFNPSMPSRGSVFDFYVVDAEDGDMVIEVLDAAWIDERGFRIRGTFSGTATPNDLAPTLEGEVRIVGTFDLEWVDGGSAAMMLMDELQRQMD